MKVTDNNRRILLQKHTFEIGFFILFIILVAFEMPRHELWFDEIQQWLIVKASHSIPGLMYQKRYEGHPGLWYIIMYILKITLHDFSYVRVLHVFISIANAAIILFAMPFKKWQRIALAFGYFFLYEYTIIVRSYSIGIFLFFVFILLYSKEHRNYILYGILFALMVNLNAYCAMLAVFCSLFLLYDVVIKKFKPTLTFWAGILIFIAGLAFAAFTMMTPPDAAYKHDPDLYFNIGGMMNVIAYLGLMFYPNLLYLKYDGLSLLFLFFGITILILYFTISGFRSNKKIVLIYCIGTFIFLFFSYLLTLQDYRHYGHFLIWWIGCLWLYKSELKKGVALIKPLNIIFSTSLIASLLFSGYCYVYDWNNIYSQAKNVSEYLKKNHLEDAILVSRPGYISYPVSYFLGQDAFSLSHNQYQKFAIFDKYNNYHELHPEADLNSLILLRESTNKRILLLMRTTISDIKKEASFDFADNRIRIDSLTTFYEHFLGGEYYYIYDVKKAEPNLNLPYQK